MTVTGTSESAHRWQITITRDGEVIHTSDSGWRNAGNSRVDVDFTPSDAGTYVTEVSLDTGGGYVVVNTQEVTVEESHEEVTESFTLQLHLAETYLSGSDASIAFDYTVPRGTSKMDVLHKVFTGSWSPLPELSGRNAVTNPTSGSAVTSVTLPPSAGKHIIQLCLAVAGEHKCAHDETTLIAQQEE